MMAKIYRITGYFVDSGDEYSEEDLKVAIEDCADVIPRHIEVKGKDIGEWEDDNPLNRFDCPKSECDRYFE